MTWTAINSTQTDADSPLDQTLMDAIRTNLDDLNTRVSAIAAFSDQAIYDDFVGTFNGAATGSVTFHTWEYNAASGTITGAVIPNHALTFAHNAGQYVLMRSAQYKMTIDFSQTYSVVMEVRHKSGQSDNTEDWAIGLQDVGTGTAATTAVSDLSDFIGFKQGNANTYTAITASTAGGGTTTVASNQGAAGSWTVLKITATPTSCEFFIDGTSVGTSSTNITALQLRPFIGFANGGGARNQYIDYVLAYFGTRPLEP